MAVAATGDPLILGEELAPKGVLDAEICAHTYLSPHPIHILHLYIFMIQRPKVSPSLDKPPFGNL